MSKKEPGIFVGLGKDPENKLTVQKSRPLTTLWQSELTLAEFKILDVYLSRIDSHKPQERTIRLSKGQLETALGVTRINKEDLKRRLKNLYNPIDLEKGNPTKIKLRSLFDEADAEQDEDGIWQIQLTCSQTAVEYFFNIEHLGYVKYKLWCIREIKSRYSYILFIYIETHRNFVTWKIPLEELKELLNCSKEETYTEYKRFNDLILKKCQKEIIEKTDCYFTYQALRSGKRIKEIQFSVKRRNEKIRIK